jgi:hypothetical protein
MSTIWTNESKAGSGWLFNQPGITFNGLLDPISGDTLTFNGEGSATVWTNQIKN